LWFPYNIYPTAEASIFKIGMLLGYAKAHHKIPHLRKSGVALCYRSSPKFRGSLLIFVQRLKLATSNSACHWGWPRPTIKTRTGGKSGRDLGLGKLPIIWGSPLVFLQRQRCSLSVSGYTMYFNIIAKNQGGYMQNKNVKYGKVSKIFRGLFYM